MNTFQVEMATEQAFQGAPKFQPTGWNVGGGPCSLEIGLCGGKHAPVRQMLEDKEKEITAAVCLLCLWRRTGKKIVRLHKM